MNYKRELFDRYSFIALKAVMAREDLSPGAGGIGAECIAEKVCDIAEAMVAEREKRVAKYNFHNGGGGGEHS
jgi:hypothetical protein